MDQKFQTSFIPKNISVSPSGGIVRERHGIRITSIYMMIAVFALIVSVGAIVGGLLWKQYLLSSQVSYKSQLAEREKQFNLDLIEQLKQINIQIDTTKQLLKKHIALSQIFGIIQQMTVSNVRFLSMDVSSPNSKSNSATISLNGYGTNLAAVAFQSDVLGKLSEYGLQKIIKNPIISYPVLDSSGAVLFGFSAMIDPGSLSYEQSIIGSSIIPVASSTSPASQQTQ